MTAAAPVRAGDDLVENLMRRAALGDMVRRQAARQGDKPAIIARSGSESRRVITYRDLDRFSNRVAHGLARMGVGRGDRVALMSHNMAEAVGIYYGILKQGAVFTSLNPSYTPAEVERQVDHSNPRVVIAGPGMAERARAGVAGARLVVMDGTPQPGEIGLSEMLDGVPDEIPGALVEENDLAMVMYTSGTESVPKGVMVTPPGDNDFHHPLLVVREIRGSHPMCSCSWRRCTPWQARER